jgi:hypothetical protein
MLPAFTAAAAAAAAAGTCCRWAWVPLSTPASAMQWEQVGGGSSCRTCSGDASLCLRRLQQHEQSIRRIASGALHQAHQAHQAHCIRRIRRIASGASGASGALHQAHQAHCIRRIIYQADCIRHFATK